MIQWPSSETIQQLGVPGALAFALIATLAVVLPPLLSREKQKAADPTAGLSAKFSALETRVDKIDDEQERHEREIESQDRRLDSIERSLAIQREVHAILGGRNSQGGG